MDGLILIDKEKSISSYDVIRKLKRILPPKTKIGHAGTLDPFATGLLIIMLGRFTKLADKIHKYDKGYTVDAQFGFETDTQDISGVKISSVDDLPPLSQADLELALKDFSGEIEQIPPKYSAVKINGKRAYDLARAGEIFTPKSRIVNVESIEIKDFRWPEVQFEMKVSTGTYVRTLVTDIGRKVGSYATAVELRRDFIGPFDLLNAIKSDTLMKEEDGTEFDFGEALVSDISNYPDLL